GRLPAFIRDEAGGQYFFAQYPLPFFCDDQHLGRAGNRVIAGFLHFLHDGAFLGRPHLRASGQFARVRSSGIYREISPARASELDGLGGNRPGISRCWFCDHWARADATSSAKAGTKWKSGGGAFMIRHAISNLNAWLAILAVVLSSSAGDVLLSRAMKRIGDLGQLRSRRGLLFLALLVLRNRYFLLGVACMAI